MYEGDQSSWAMPWVQNPSPSHRDKIQDLQPCFSKGSSPRDSVFISALAEWVGLFLLGWGFLTWSLHPTSLAVTSCFANELPSPRDVLLQAEHSLQLLPSNLTQNISNAYLLAISKWLLLTWNFRSYFKNIVVICFLTLLHRHLDPFHVLFCFLILLPEEYILMYACSLSEHKKNW